MTPPAVPAAPGPVDWSGEIAPLTGESAALPAPGRSVTGAGRPMDRLTTAEERGPQQLGSLDLRNGLPSEVVTDPISTEEAYRGSLKAMLQKYVGNYVVATFHVGNDYMTIYQEGRDRYIVSDIYSLKFIEFYDTRCRDICDEVLRSGWTPDRRT